MLRVCFKDYSRSFLSYFVLFSFLLLQNCGNKNTAGSGNGRVQIQLNRSSSLKAQADPPSTTLKLPKNLCYILHATGPGVERVGPDPAGCGPAAGFGTTSSKAYSYGQDAEIVVTVGPNRTLQLIGFESPLGISAADGTAICGDFFFDYIPQSNASRSFRVEAKLNGAVMKKPMVLFYEAQATILEGDNIVTLNPIAYVPTPFTSAFGFGAPLLRENIPNASGALAQCTEGNLRTMNTEYISPSSSAIRTPRTSNGVTLRFVTSVPIIMPAPKMAEEGTYELKTGLGEAILGE